MVKTNPSHVVLQLFKLGAFLVVLYAGGNWDGINLWWKIQQMQKGNFNPSPLLIPRSSIR